MAGEIAAEWIKIPDGNGGFNKVWVRDSTARRSIAQLQTEIDDLSAADVGAIPLSQKGAASGVAELDANGLVPSSQLPSYVDDVLEYASSASFPATGETGKIYVDLGTNLTYRWSGSAYVEISPSLALGITSSTAFRGDRGNAAYEHAVTNKGSAFASGLYKITTNAEGHVTGAAAVAKADITALGIPGSVPSKTSDLNNDSGFITASNVPTAVSELTNDAGYITTETDPTVPSWAKASTKPSYTAAEVGALPDTTVIPTVPTNVSAFVNDAGYMTSFTETDPTVPAWAKAASKPTYTASEVGALPSTTQIPSATSELTNDSGFITSAAVPTKTSDLTNDSGYITGYTETDPTVPSWAKASSKPTYTAAEVGALPSSTVIPSKTSDLTNDSGFITGYTETDPTVPAWAKAANKPSYTATEVGALPDTTPIPTVPTNVSAFTNDAGYLTSYTETDPTVPSWAKASSKPSYTASEVLTSSQLDAANSGITADYLAVDDASVLCGVTAIVPTLSAGAHETSYGGCWYYKIGHRVRCHIGVKGLTASTQTTLWQMPSGYIPKSGLAFDGQGDSLSTISRCRITSTGEVRVHSASKLATAYIEYDAFS